MGNEDYGESSRGSSSGSDRPLKKAKYVWQVKGKYHLKANCQNSNESLGDCSSSSSTPPCSQSPQEPLSDNESDQADKGQCIDKFLARTEAILDSGGSESVGASRLFDQAGHSLNNAVSESETNAQHKWQARQIARGYIDNTINSVLESWVQTPGFDAEDFLERCDDNHIEDEGILMAIQAHGLSTSAAEEPSLAFVRPDELADNTLDKIDSCRAQKEPSAAESAGNSNESDIQTQEVVYPVDILNAAILVAIERKGLSNAANKQQK